MCLTGSGPLGEVWFTYSSDAVCVSAALMRQSEWSKQHSVQLSNGRPTHYQLADQAWHQLNLTQIVPSMFEAAVVPQISCRETLGDHAMYPDPSRGAEPCTARPSSHTTLSSSQANLEVRV